MAAADHGGSKLVAGFEFVGAFKHARLLTYILMQTLCRRYLPVLDSLDQDAVIPPIVVIPAILFRKEQRKLDRRKLRCRGEVQDDLCLAIQGCEGGLGRRGSNGLGSLRPK